MFTVSVLVNRRVAAISFSQSNMAAIMLKMVEQHRLPRTFSLELLFRMKKIILSGEIYRNLKR